ncbi:MAG TPA: N-acetylglucosamine-6-phosphate deacetylase [Anaerolineales bacterium]
MQLPESVAIRNLRLMDDCTVGENAAVAVIQGKIAYAGPAAGLPAQPGLPYIDGQGWYAAPGFLELQLNGAYGYDFTGQPESIPLVAARLAESGVTAFLPTIITSPLEDYPSRLAAVAAAQKSSEPGAKVLGAHLEGPFLNPASRGAHRAALFCDPTLDALRYFDPIAAVCLVTLAVERNGGLDAVRWLQARGVTVSIGHSAATAEQAGQAFAAGVRYATHLYNAMPPLHHREPGLIGALLTDPSVRCGLIVDGIHSHPLMVDLAYRCKGAAGLTLVTDAISAMGMPPGQYTIGGETVWVDGTAVRQSEGRLAGSVLSMDQAVRNMVSYTGCSPAEAVCMASATPAEVLGLGDRLGHLKPGFPADLVLLDPALRVQATFVRGQAAFVTPQAQFEILEG